MNEENNYYAESIADVCVAIVMLENMIAVLTKQNTKNDKHINYVVSVLQDAKNKEYRKQSNLSKAFADSIKKVN